MLITILVYVISMVIPAPSMGETLYNDTSNNYQDALDIFTYSTRSISLPYLVFLVLFITLVLVSSGAYSEEDEVYFGPPDEETEIILVGSSAISLRVRFGQECSNYSLELESRLFLFPTNSNRDGNVLANSTHGHMMILNSTAPPGEYHITIDLSYDNSDGARIFKTFNKTIYYLKALEIKKVSIPNNSNKRFSISVETFLEFDEFIVFFDSDGDIGIDPENLCYYNLSMGSHTFETRVFRAETREGGQEVGYYISAIYQNKSLVLTEKNIVVSIDWEEENEDSGVLYRISNDVLSLTILVIVIILILIIFEYYYYFRKRVHSKKRKAE